MQVRKWITDWNLDTEKKHTLLRLVYEALVDCKKRYLPLWILGQLCPGLVVFAYLTFTLLSFSEAAAKVMVELLGSYTEDNASQARVDAHRYDGSLSFDLMLSFSVIYTHALLSQVHRPCPERPKQLSVRPSPGFETSAFPGGRTHPRCKKLYHVNANRQKFSD